MAITVGRELFNLHCIAKETSITVATNHESGQAVIANESLHVAPQLSEKPKLFIPSFSLVGSTPCIRGQSWLITSPGGVVGQHNTSSVTPGHHPESKRSLSDIWKRVRVSGLYTPQSQSKNLHLSLMRNSDLFLTIFMFCSIMVTLARQMFYDNVLAYTVIPLL